MDFDALWDVIQQSAGLEVGPKAFSLAGLRLPTGSMIGDVELNLLPASVKLPGERRRMSGREVIHNTADWLGCQINNQAVDKSASGDSWGVIGRFDASFQPSDPSPNLLNGMQ